MYKLYEYPPSGNCYKVRLLLNQLEIPFESIEVDILKGESRTPEFLAINPNGRTPVLEIKPNVFLAESNAIIFYLSQNTAYFPEDPWERAEVMQWLFFEQYSHEPNIATSRFIIKYLQEASAYREVLQKKNQLGYAALKIMEKHLNERTFFVGNRYSIADIALYAYTHVAEEGGFSLEEFPKIQTWLKSVVNQSKYISLS